MLQCSRQIRQLATMLCRGACLRRKPPFVLQTLLLLQRTLLRPTRGPCLGALLAHSALQGV